MDKLSVHNRNYLITKILSGQIDIKNFTINPPSNIHRFKAEQVYHDTYKEAERRELMYEEESITLLQDLGLWSTEQEEQLKAAPAQLEDLKFRLYDNFFRTNEQNKIRKALKTLEKKIENLSAARSIFESATCEGVASLLKIQYLICCNVETDLDWNKQNPLTNRATYIDYLFNEFFLNKISDSTIRYLSRTEPWRSMWGAAKISGLGINLLTMSDEQKSLILWSRMYDSIFDSPDCPSEGIIDDDDMLDGWLISENRKRASEKKGRGVGDKSGANEIFIPVDNVEDAQRVFDLNDTRGKMLQRERTNLTLKHGAVEEQHFPDARREIMELARQQAKG